MHCTCISHGKVQAGARGHVVCGLQGEAWRHRAYWYARSMTRTAGNESRYLYAEPAGQSRPGGRNFTQRVDLTELITSI